MKNTVESRARRTDSGAALNTLERARAEEGFQQAMLLGDVTLAGIRRLSRALGALGAAAHRRRAA